MESREKKMTRLAAQVLRLARDDLLVRLRFLAPAIARLAPTPMRAGTVETDGERLCFRPLYLLKSYAEERERVPRDLLHCILHCVFKHMFVSPNVDRALWDLAADIAVESTITSLGLRSLAAAREREQEELIDAHFADLKSLCAEPVYRALRERRLGGEEIDRLRGAFSPDSHATWYPPQKDEQTAAGESDGETDAHAEGENGDKAEDETDEKRDADSGGEDGKRAKTDGDAGAGGDDKTDAEADAEADAANGGESQSAAAVDAEPAAAGREIERELDRARLAAEWQKIAARVQTDVEGFSALQGSGAGGLVQQLAAVTRERYDYASFLKKFAVRGEVMRQSMDEFDNIFYTYGLRLYGEMPLIEPLEYREERRVRELVIAIDTSGSTVGEVVQAFLRKTYNILKTTESFYGRIDLHILQCDEAVVSHEKVTSQDEFDAYFRRMRIYGGGGTDFRPVFRFVDELLRAGEFQKLGGLIYFTDGYGAFPKEKPPYPTAIVFVDEGENNPTVPPWAIRLVLPEEEITGEEA